jgi:hypothetical protein
MTTRAIRGLAVAVLCAGLAAPAEAAGPRVPALSWPQGIVAAARLWLGDLLGGRTPAPHGGKTDGQAALTAVAGADEQVLDEDGNPIPVGVAGIFKLKQHVDNPGQTAM